VVANGYMFGGNYGQIECFDLSKPGDPRFVGLCNTGFQWSAGLLRDGLLYVPTLVGLDIVRVPQRK